MDRVAKAKGGPGMGRVKVDTRDVVRSQSETLRSPGWTTFDDVLILFRGHIGGRPKSSLFFMYSRYVSLFGQPFYAL
jgi:hypothetical protein